MGAYMIGNHFQIRHCHYRVKSCLNCLQLQEWVSNSFVRCSLAACSEGKGLHGAKHPTPWKKRQDQQQVSRRWRGAQDLQTSYPLLFKLAMRLAQYAEADNEPYRPTSQLLQT